MTNPGIGLGMGRRASPSEKDLPFRLELRQPELAAPHHRATTYWPLFSKVLNQGPDGICVGAGWRHWLECAPIRQVTRRRLEPSMRTIYRGAAALDIWTENDHEEYAFGSDERSGWKFLRSLGMVGEGNSTRDVETIASFLGGRDIDNKKTGGPLVVGLPWYPSMNVPDAEGFSRLPRFLPPSEAGHCVCVARWNEQQGTIGGPNSWGSDWNLPLKGWWKMSAEDFQRLLTLSGSAWTAMETRVNT